MATNQRAIATIAIWLVIPCPVNRSRKIDSGSSAAYGLNAMNRHAKARPAKTIAPRVLTRSRSVRTPDQTITTVTGGSQGVPGGPVAGQEAIKQLGTNGGGFFNANSAHPFENPSEWSNSLQMLAIFAIPAGLCFTFGRVVGDRRQGWAVLAAMALIFVAAVVGATSFEQQGNPALAALGADQTASALQSGGNMEGKEVRFGIAASSLFAVITTAASCGAVNAMHDSFTPLGGMVPTALMQLGEVVFGGVGSGLYGMLVFALLAVFEASAFRAFQPCLVVCVK